MARPFIAIVKTGRSDLNARCLDRQKTISFTTYYMGRLFRYTYTQSMGHNPIDPFTILGLQNPSYDTPELHKIN